jgi:hypothetical protein
MAAAASSAQKETYPGVEAINNGKRALVKTSTLISVNQQAIRKESLRSKLTYFFFALVLTADAA